MAYDNSDTNKSVFNAGIALTERIDALQRALNSARFNPLSRNPETLTFNYEIMVSACDGLLSEVWAKMTDKERLDAKRIKNLVHLSMTNAPPIELSKDGKEVLILNKKNYQIIIKLIEIYEMKCKDFLDVHDMNSPSKSDPRRAVIDM